MIILELAIPVAIFKTFDYYSEDENIKIGSVVSINFARTKTIGLVVNIKDSSSFELKKINNKILSLNNNIVNFIKKVADYNIIPIGLVFKFVFNDNYLLNNIKENKLYYFNNDGKITEKQKNIVDFLKENKDKSFSFNELKSLCSLNILKTLVKNGIICEKKENQHNYNIENIVLNTLSIEQENVYKKILELDNKPILLEGITGSGKTEIYFHLFEYFIKQDKQVLFLLPEIALTSQFINRIKSQFLCKDVAVWHSAISNSQKKEIWNKVLNNEIKLVIGARSSLFLPFSNLSLIVVDEEHDSSYKQVDNGCYNARDMAVLKAKIENIKIVLGSATPSLESLINVDNNKYNYLFLKSRFGESAEPIIDIIDLKQEKKNDGYLSKKLILEIKEELDKKNQVLLFMNRRGYSPIAICKECGERIICPNCSSSLTVHKSSGLYVCHQCGYKKKESLICPFCGMEGSIIYFGPGVEKIEEEAKKYFPDKNTVIITSDTIQNMKEINEIVRKISNKEIDIIIGTQMITKGYDFKDLTLVGVLDADASLFGADFRATERTYQLLTQVVGRAGRRERQGRAFIQTYNPNNVVIQALKNNNKDLIINFEKENRQLIDLPPYGKMVLISLSGKEEIKVYRKIKEIASVFPLDDRIEVYGPTQMNIYKLKNEFRFKLIVKTKNDINIQKLVLNIINFVKIDNNLKLKIDVNPYFIG